MLVDYQWKLLDGLPKQRTREKLQVRTVLNVDILWLFYVLKSDDIDSFLPSPPPPFPSILSLIFSQSLLPIPRTLIHPSTPSPLHSSLSLPLTLSLPSPFPHPSFCFAGVEHLQRMLKVLNFSLQSIYISKSQATLILQSLKTSTLSPAKPKPPTVRLK